MIDRIEKNIHGAWVVYGDIGMKQYYGFSKKRAEELYKEECERTVFYEQKGE